MSESNATERPLILCCCPDSVDSDSHHTTPFLLADKGCNYLHFEFSHFSLRGLLAVVELEWDDLGLPAAILSFQSWEWLSRDDGQKVVQLIQQRLEAHWWEPLLEKTCRTEHGCPGTVVRSN
jgi:hypothetical protein